MSLPHAVYVSPSVVTQAEAAVDEALRNGSWLDVATVLPPSLAVQDVAQLLGKCGLSQEEDGKRGQVGWKPYCAAASKAAKRA
jgi:hypothetical protein